VLTLQVRGVLASRPELGFFGPRPQRQENISTYWFSMGRQVHIRPVLASMTDQFVAGTGISDWAISNRRDTEYTCETYM
jgi:hypothetical protein